MLSVIKGYSSVIDPLLCMGSPALHSDDNKIVITIIIVIIEVVFITKDICCKLLLVRSREGRWEREGSQDGGIVKPQWVLGAPLCGAAPVRGRWLHP